VEAVYYIIFAIAGLLVGSFLNVCIDRVPKGKSIINPPSHCDSCGKRLAAGDLIPIFSYLRTRGKCRFCGAPIPIRVLWVEVATGILFALLFWKFGLTPDLAVMIFYISLFLVLFVIDLETGLILNIVTFPAMAIALVISCLRPDIAVSAGSFHLSNTAFLNAGLSSLIGGAVGFVIFFIIVVVSGGGMGVADIYMAALIGLAVGYPNIFAAILIAILTGGILAIVLLVSKIKKRKDAIPFGPFLAVGAVAALIFGKIILEWYLTIV